jgi:NAD(P)-dependent dehydrogenase (short-subunit alcohol dehydrogenase family)
LITGASRGIGLQTAICYARAGACLTIVARKQETLDVSKDKILREQPSAQVLTFPADVRDVKKAEEAVTATVAHFGRLDILVTNAATIRAANERMYGNNTLLFNTEVHREQLLRTVTRQAGGMCLKSTFVEHTILFSTHALFTSP